MDDLAYADPLDDTLTDEDSRGSGITTAQVLYETPQDTVMGRVADCNHPWRVGRRPDRTGSGPELPAEVATNMPAALAFSNESGYSPDVQGL